MNNVSILPRHTLHYIHSATFHFPVTVQKSKHADFHKIFFFFFLLHNIDSFNYYATQRTVRHVHFCKSFYNPTGGTFISHTGLERTDRHFFLAFFFFCNARFQYYNLLTISYNIHKRTDSTAVRFRQ